jgi:hypothetical protein
MDISMFSIKPCSLIDLLIHPSLMTLSSTAGMSWALHYRTTRTFSSPSNDQLVASPCCTHHPNNPGLFIKHRLGHLHASLRDSAASLDACSMCLSRSNEDGAVETLKKHLPEYRELFLIKRLGFMPKRGVKTIKARRNYAFPTKHV